jgi:hypothetical protein
VTRLTPWSAVNQKLTVAPLAKTFPPLMEPEGSSPCSQQPGMTSYRELDEWSAHTFHQDSSLMLSSHQRLGLLSDLSPSDIPTKTLYAFLGSPMRATSHTHLIQIFGNQYELLISSSCNFLHPPVTSSLLGAYIPLSTAICSSNGMFCAQIRTHDWKP